MTTPENSALTPPLTMSQRERTIETLSRSFADDAITMEEFEHRAEAVYRALTLVDLQQLVADLPGGGSTASQLAPSLADTAAFPAEDSIRTVFGNTERGGNIRVPRRLRLRNMFGNIELNYTRAIFAPGVTEVEVRCTFGNIEIWVPRGVRVELACSSVFASVGSTGSEHHDEYPSDAADPLQPVLRLSGRALFANVEVHVMEAGVQLVQLPT